jgi:hypothetical protein
MVIDRLLDDCFVAECPDGFFAANRLEVFFGIEESANGSFAEDPDS